jgi:hypothetical protein
MQLEKIIRLKCIPWTHPGFFFLFGKPYVIIVTRRDPGEFYANDQAVFRD